MDLYEHIQFEDNPYKPSKLGKTPIQKRLNKKEYIHQLWRIFYD